jgi:hypothetical protein
LVGASLLYGAPPSSAAGVADVGITLTGPAAVVPGGAYTVVQKTSNVGLTPALTVDTTFTVSGVPAGSTVTGTNDPTSCTTTPTTVACHYGSGIGTNSSKSVTINLTAPTSLNSSGYAAVTHSAHESAVFDNLLSDTNGANDNATQSNEVYTSDLGVTLTGDEPGVTNGLDQGLHWDGQNVGTRTQPSISWVLKTGGVVDNDANNPLPAGCTISGTSNQTVTCTQSNVASGGTFSAYVLVKTPAIGTSMTSTAQQTPAIPEFGGSSANNTASVVTTLSPISPCGFNCMQAVVKQGQSITWNAPTGDLVETLAVPANANWTGGAVKVTLRRITPTITCSGQACYPVVPEYLAVPRNTTSTPDPASPLVATSDYLFNQVCGGNGVPSGCHRQHFLATGIYTGDAPPNPDCPSAGTTSFNTGSFNNCAQQYLKINNNKLRVVSLFLRDISLPIISK